MFNCMQFMAGEALATVEHLRGDAESVFLSGVLPQFGRHGQATSNWLDMHAGPMNDMSNLFKPGIHLQAEHLS